MSIKPLSRETIKLINSTQVISSIYSAIKELVENALDAQAQNIEVNLVDNGLSLIEVKDNGTGISKKDAPYMALPAYTSKITDFNDLDLLKTYGFRGEGLNAVCQVSDLTILTKTEDDDHMTKYTLDYDGNIVSTEPTHGSRGTTVHMRNLFKNFPVRRNLLTKKRIDQEMKAVEILLKSYAICQPSIRLTFRINSSTIFTKLNCKNVVEAFKGIVGVQTFYKMAYMKKCFPKTQLQLFVPKKENDNVTEISQTGYQFLCVNHRPIKSKEIQNKINKRISEYFSQKTSNCRKFIFCIILEVDSLMLDVNLEPNKDHILLQNEAAVIKEIDELLLNLYDLQDSQFSTLGEIRNGVSGINIEINEEEKEWPACKKRKYDSQKDNICSKNVYATNDPKLTEDKQSRKSDNEFLNGIIDPMLSDSDSNDVENFNNKKNNEIGFVEMSEIESSELFDIVENEAIKDAVEETLSQLPKVDLGEDFDWQEIMNRNKNSNDQEKNSDGPANIRNHQIDDLVWSKGQVPGLQVKGGVVINGANGKTNNKIDLRGNNEESESFDFGKGTEIIDDDIVPPSNDNDLNSIEINEFKWDVNLKKTRKRTPTKQNNDDTLNTSSRTSNVIKKFQHTLSDLKQTKIPFAGENACLNSAPSAFAMFCAEIRSKIVQKHPDLNPAEVAACLNKQWKEISSEEREYYQDLANQHIKSKSDVSLTQSSKKSKYQVSEARKEKNKKHFVSVLENMKTNKSEVKTGSMIMRTSKSWDIDLSFVTQKFRTLSNKVTQSIVGPLNTSTWILNLNLQLLVFNIFELHTQLNIEGFDISQIDRDYVQSIVNQWFHEKKDMSIFHPFHAITMIKVSGFIFNYKSNRCT
ncbi:DNA mismatch repair protein MutL-like isoform X2 [Phymastichus coffea]|uniref:DNA mismatch repair protein MutL-like isoform X2 n=1 Tax=Phymastichus coffea TaxID=108790 RepID=UPI00273C8927|nr:DNA mismatch repair protein MutL-like isoform X2 [Phymastichus coffea]